MTGRAARGRAAGPVPRGPDAGAAAARLEAACGQARQLLRDLHEAMQGCIQARRDMDAKAQEGIDMLALQAQTGVAALSKQMATHMSQVAEGLPLRLACPYCHTILGVLAGAEGKCGGCGAVFAVNVPEVPGDEYPATSDRIREIRRTLEGG